MHTFFSSDIYRVKFKSHNPTFYYRRLQNGPNNLIKVTLLLFFPYQMKEIELCDPCSVQVDKWKKQSRVVNSTLFLDIHF